VINPHIKGIQQQTFVYERLLILTFGGARPWKSGFVTKLLTAMYVTATFDLSRCSIRRVTGNHAVGLETKGLASSPDQNGALNQRLARVGICLCD
jgi:hypothetical protein